MMKTNPFDLEATSDRLRTLATHGHFDEKALDRALTIAGHVPNRMAWQKFLDYVLLILGAAFTISGVFFFFAFNWADMHRFLKFGLIEGGIFVVVGLAFYLGLNQLSGKIALMVAALFVGALLAVFGQAYQTGADAYQLFLTWAALIIGWVVISAYAPLWLGLLVLLNITVVTYWEQVLGGNSPAMYITLSLLNVASLLVWEWANQQGVSWLQHRWLPRLIVPATFIFLVIPTLDFIFTLNRTGFFLIIAPFCYGVFTIFILFFYKQKVPDLFMLTVSSFSIIVVVTSTVLQIFDVDFDNALVFLILSLIIIGQAALAVNWLRSVAKSWEASNV